MQLEELELEFDKKIFINGSFNLSNLSNLEILKLDFVKVNDLITNDKLNLPQSLKTVELNCILRRKVKIDNLDLSILSNAETVDLSNMYINNIINIPNNIRILNIDYCGLKSISNLPLHGDRISLQNNKLKIIPQLGEELTDLTELNISNNKIEQIEMLPKNVTHFYASNNKLRKIPITAENKNLSTIELDYNLIDTIPELAN